MTQRSRDEYTPNNERAEVRSMIDRHLDDTNATIDNQADKADKAIDQAADKAKQMTSDVKDAARDAQHKAEAVASDVNTRADETMTTAGEKMEELAQSVREKAPEGKLGDVAYTAANKLEEGGRYLQEADLESIRTDLERVIRQRPIESLLIGFGVGYLLARATRR
ncbi:MAG TPA: hypothetical protein VFT99_23215 [Roseiflexaceae bacterium]|nr:hypothetical protein [Roseiflexaceae bacterium]